jgi:hypothetical protein
MKKLITYLSFLSLCFVFSGCPYEADVAIDTPSIPVNPKLIGTWEIRNNQDDSYKVSKKNDFTYAIVKSNKKSKEKGEQIYLAFISLLNGTYFLNVKEDMGEASSKKYMLYKMEMKGDAVFTLAEITDNIDERFVTVDELRKFIIDNMKNSYFYNRDEAEYFKTGN